ncbi:helix-turn-helix transcriptional regulator [Bacillus inaquosorum]|uniref:helix-turn-helix domain-containing protein n=1 Tax=Bacillus inaquosorum TaxID=483913 RepID=UPI00227E5F72|nr:helix-turn-helix transcriptional regulator [Bacillus inaquosorum]MCY7975587.1 helix-turn-helix transcriptional regulator [Bacillus inaquosorum]MCY9409660.1 helix-turn-helix transcriptional regulator [Bacillus inaquosorum]MEC0589472.1 helix-turn-helix transcriptional regulator [Bacillus inaquosorum]
MKKQWKPVDPRLNELMHEYSVSIDDLVKRTGLSKQRINDYVSGVKSNMNIGTAMTIADAIGCSLEELYVWNFKERRQLTKKLR